MKSLFDTKNSQHIESKVIQIIEIISDKNDKFFDNVGLMGGYSGISLFYLECYKHFKEEKYLNKGIEILESVITNSHINKNLSFCDGIAGVGWLINYAEECNYINGTNNILSDIDDYLFNNFTIPMLNHHIYDFLHGAIGSGVYFLSRTSSHKALVYLESIVSNIYEKINHPKALFGIEYPTINKKIQYDLGISHGIPGILYFLVSTFKAKILESKSLECIKIIIDFLKSNITPHTDGRSYFPNEANNKGESSRLAWCYGDLGICSVLLNAAKAINDFELEKNIIEIIKYNCTRTDIQKNIIFDSSFCHGSSGVAHIFANWHYLYGIENTKNAAIFWYNYTIADSSPFFSIKNGYAIFRPSTKTYQINDGLLEGNAGVGLSLLSAINPNIRGWNKSFLLQ